MTWHPVSSEEVRELREREAEQLLAPETAPEHDPRCRAGWLGEDEEGRPRPCPVCRPHVTAQRQCLTCGTSGVRCDAQRSKVGQPCCPDCSHRREGAGRAA